MLDASTTPPNVFLFHIAPAPGVSAAELERCLMEQSAGLSLASRPYLDPALISHRILRGTGVHAWLLAFEGLDAPPEGHTPSESLEDALLGEVRTRLEGAGVVTASTGYADLSLPAPGPGFGRAPTSEGGAVVFADDDQPSWEDYASGSGAAEAGTELPTDLLADIEQNRAVVPGEKGLKAWGKGHMYGGGSDKAHVAYVASYLENRANRASFADRRKILAFRAFQAREGSTAAINTYDNQIVTWGTGWGGLGWMGKVMARAVANQEVRDRFGRCGMRYRGKNVYDVVDLRTKKVITSSREALEVIRASLPLLYLLIDAARNPDTRDAVTEAQLLTFMEGSGNFASAEAVATQALFNLIAHLKHWAPGYVIGCLEWALPQLDGGSPSIERDKQLAVLVGRYFYGKARKFKWIPAWNQFQLYWKHMKEDGLDCLSDPFIQASAAPTDDPFAGTATRSQPNASAQVSAPAATKAEGSCDAAASAPVFQNAPLAGQPDLEKAAHGKGALRRGARGAGVKALQEALLALGYEVPGGADGIFGQGAENAIKSFQAKSGLTADGIVGPGTLKAIDTHLGTRAAS